MNVNEDLLLKLDELTGDIKYLAKSLLIEIDKGKKESQLEEFILGEINEIIGDENV